MAGMKFPRTMVRGAFKGRHFETSKDYHQARAEAKRVQQRLGAAHTKLKSSDDFRFHLTVVAGSLEMTVTGDPRRPADVDQLLDVLASYSKGA